VVGCDLLAGDAGMKSPWASPNDPRMSERWRRFTTPERQVKALTERGVGKPDLAGLREVGTRQPPRSVSAKNTAMVIENWPLAKDTRG